MEKSLLRGVVIKICAVLCMVVAVSVLMGSEESSKVSMFKRRAVEWLAETFKPKEQRTLEQKAQQQREYEEDAQGRFAFFVNKLEKSFQRYKYALDNATKSIDKDGSIEIKTNIQEIERTEKEICDGIDFAKIFLEKKSVARIKALDVLGKLSPVSVFYKLTQDSACYKEFADLFGKLKLANEGFEVVGSDIAASTLILGSDTDSLEGCLTKIESNPSKVVLTHQGQFGRDKETQDQIWAIAKWNNIEDKKQALQFLEAYYYEAFRVNTHDYYKKKIKESLDSIRMELIRLKVEYLPEELTQEQKDAFDFSYKITGLGEFSNHTIMKLVLDDNFKNHYNVDFKSPEDSLKILREKAQEFDVIEKINMLKNINCNTARYSFASGYLVRRLNTFTIEQREELKNLDLTKQLVCFETGVGVNKKKVLKQKRIGFIKNMKQLGNLTAIKDEEPQMHILEAQPALSEARKVDFSSGGTYPTGEIPSVGVVTATPSMQNITTTTSTSSPITNPRDEPTTVTTAQQITTAATAKTLIPSITMSTTITSISPTKTIDDDIQSQNLLGLLERLEAVEQKLGPVYAPMPRGHDVEEVENILGDYERIFSQEEIDDIKTIWFAYHKLKGSLSYNDTYDFEGEDSAVRHQGRRNYWQSKLSEENQKKELYGDYIKLAKESKHDVEFLKKVIEAGLPIKLEDASILEPETPFPTTPSTTTMTPTTGANIPTAPTTTSLYTTTATRTNLSSVTTPPSTRSQAGIEGVSRASGVVLPPSLTGWRSWAPVRWATAAWNGITTWLYNFGQNRWWVRPQATEKK